MRRDTVSMPRKLGALVMAMGLAASLGVTTTATAAAQDPYTMATPAAGENHPALQKFYAQRVQWGPCLRRSDAFIDTRSLPGVSQYG